MWYSNHRKADRIVRKPEHIYHSTKHNFTHPIIDPSESNKALGFGGDYMGEGFYATKNKDIHTDYAKQTKYTRKYKLPYGFRLLTNVIPAEEINDIINKLNEKFFNNSLKIDYTYIHEMTFKDLTIIVNKFSGGNLPTTLNNMLYQIGYDGLEYPAYTNFSKPKNRTNDEPNILVWNHDAINNPRKFVRERHLGTEDHNNKLQSAKEHKETALRIFSLISNLSEDRLIDVIKNNYQYKEEDNKVLDLSRYQQKIQERLVYYASDYIKSLCRDVWYNSKVIQDDAVNTLTEIIKNNYKLDYNGVIVDLSVSAVNSVLHSLVKFVYQKIKNHPDLLAKVLLNNNVYHFQGLDVDLGAYSHDMRYYLIEALKKYLEQNPLELEKLEASNFKYVYNGLEIQFNGMHDFHIPIRGKL